MFTPSQLKQMKELFLEAVQASEKRLGTKIEAGDKKVIDTLDYKIEIVHDFNKNAHTELMSTFTSLELANNFH